MHETAVTMALRQMEAAFAGVRLGDGISLSEANVIDDYGSDQYRAAARAGDESEDWRKIPDELIECHPYAMCFMDDAGLRFHLPAYMHFALRRFGDTDSVSANSAQVRLCDFASVELLRRVLTTQQIEAVIQFLKMIQGIDELAIDESDLALALRHWHGDQAAVRQSKARSEAQDRLIGQFASLSTELGTEWFRKCLDGELPADQTRRLQGLFQEMTGGDPAG